MGEDRRVALSTDGKQRFINRRRLDGGGKFNQNVACVGKGQLAQIKAGQSCGIVHLRPKLAGYAQPSVRTAAATCRKAALRSSTNFSTVMRS